MNRRTILILAALSALSLGGYLLFSHQFMRIGFPLDDAWIHQTYARNLALLGEWSFIPGQPSGGSTGPLWGVFLAIGYVLRLGPYVWTYILGWLVLFGLGVFGAHVFNIICPEQKSWSLWAGILLIFEWHLVWGAGSGMETLLFASIALIVLTSIVVIDERSEHLKQRPRAGIWLGLGALIGLSVWLRPDGITLLAPIGLWVIVSPILWPRKMVSLLWVGAGFLALFGPYLLFNNAFAETWLPSTYFAKQAEYAFLQSRPFWKRWFAQAVLPMIGVGVALLPGFVLNAVKAVNNNRWSRLLPALWVIGYISIYAWRLPVTYQHGRYIMPAMPTFFFWGFAGLADFVQLRAKSIFIRVLNRVWVISAMVVLVAFWWIGARTYARDVAIIESEMVTIAHWVAENTPPEALVATHDIGALGFFANRPLLDLAGLISPEVIPYLWDDENLAEYMDARGADYLVTFPGWYPNMIAPLIPIFQTDAPYGPEIGGENMAIYRWRIP